MLNRQEKITSEKSEQTEWPNATEEKLVKIVHRFLQINRSLPEGVSYSKTVIEGMQNRWAIKTLLDVFVGIVENEDIWQKLAEATSLERAEEEKKLLLAALDACR